MNGRRGGRRQRVHRRAISTSLGYVLTLAIATLLVTGLLIAGGDFVSSERERVIRSELQVVGEQIATSIGGVDSLAIAGSGSTSVRFEHDLPDDVTGSTYQVHLVGGDDPHLRLNATHPTVSVEVSLTNRTDLGTSRAGGGTIAVVYDDSSDEVVIENA